MKPSVFVVVLAWNRWSDTQECLHSLVQSQPEETQLLVVDNGSTDGTADRVRGSFPQVTLMRLPQNVGVNRGYNAGMERAMCEGAEFIIVMNNDTWAYPGLVDGLVSALREHPEAGVAAPKIVFYDDSEKIWSAGARWRSFPPGVKFLGLERRDGPCFNEPRDLEFATSCCLALKTGVLREVGLFDPAYMFYYDDWDFALRVRRRGYTIRYVPSAVVKHKVSASTTKQDQSGHWAAIEGRDCVRFYLRNVGGLALVVMTLWVVLRELVRGHLRQAVAYVHGTGQGLAVALADRRVSL
jgi:hypothetical protein